MDPDQDKNRRQILYPMAYGVPHLLTHISDAKTGEKYLCPGCSKDMVPRKGDIKRHHFAHKASQDRCDSDNALHETAKEAIRQGFLKAQDQNEEYLVKFPCQRCERPVPTNVAVEGATISTEITVVPGTRSDLAVTNRNGKTPRLIMEIVVTHDLEKGTQEKYQDSGIPVVKIRPTWDSVNKLLQEACGEGTLNIPKSTCPPCRKWLEHIEAKLKSAIKLGQRNGIEPITRDDYDGAPLRWATRNNIHKLAEKLAGLGFQQHFRNHTELS